MTIGTATHLSSNQDLYDYLIRLVQGLKDRGAIELSKIATEASRQAASMSTEFLGGSRIALRRMLSEGKTVLEPSEEADIQDVLQQLTAAINRWPQKKDWVGRFDYETLAICRTLALARAVLAAAVAEKPAGRFMIRSRTRVVQRHPEGSW